MSVLFEEDVNLAPHVFPEAAGFSRRVPREWSPARPQPVFVHCDDGGTLNALLPFGFTLVLALRGLRQPCIIG